MGLQTKACDRMAVSPDKAKAVSAKNLATPSPERGSTLPLNSTSVDEVQALKKEIARLQQENSSLKEERSALKEKMLRFAMDVKEDMSKIHERRKEETNRFVALRDERDDLLNRLDALEKRFGLFIPSVVHCDAKSCSSSITTNVVQEQDVHSHTSSRTSTFSCTSSFYLFEAPSSLRDKYMKHKKQKLARPDKKEARVRSSNLDVLAKESASCSPQGDGPASTFDKVRLEADALAEQDFQEALAKDIASCSPQGNGPTSTIDKDLIEADAMAKKYFQKALAEATASCSPQGNGPTSTIDKALLEARALREKLFQEALAKELARRSPRGNESKNSVGGKICPGGTDNKSDMVDVKGSDDKLPDDIQNETGSSNVGDGIEMDRDTEGIKHQQTAKKRKLNFPKKNVASAKSLTPSRLEESIEASARTSRRRIP